MPNPRKYDNAAARQRAYRERRKLARPKPRQELPRAKPIAVMPNTARWKQLRERAETDLQTLFQEMEEYRDQRSETWLDGERGQTFQQRLDRVEEAIQAVSDID